MKNKVLVVSQHFWPENVKINDICEGFVQRGLRVDVLAGQPNNMLGEFPKGYATFRPEEESRSGYRIFRAGDIKKAGGSSIRLFLKYVTFPITTLIKCPEFRKQKYDAIFVYQTSPIFMCKAAVRLGEKLGIPVTMYVRELWPAAAIRTLDVRSNLFGKFLAGVSKKTYLKASRIVVPVEKWRTYFMRELMAPGNCVEYIPMWPDKEPELGRSVDDMLDRFAGSFNFLYTGSITECAFFDNLVDIAKDFWTKGIRDIRFIIIGDGMYMEQFRKNIESRKVREYFFLEGEKSSDQIRQYRLAADAILMKAEPDDSPEMLPEVWADSLAAGHPVLMSMSGEIRRILKNAGCGYASEPNDREGLENNILRLYKMPAADLARMGANSRIFCRENYDRESGLDKIVELMFQGAGNARLADEIQPEEE